MGTKNEGLIRKAIQISIICLLLFACVKKEKQSYNSLIINLQKIDDEIQFNIKIYGPVDEMKWDHSLFFGINNIDKINNLQEVKNLNFKKKPVLIIENKKGEIRFFNDYIKGITYPYFGHGLVMSNTFLFSLEENETKLISFNIPFQIEHFAINKISIGEKIRIHYVQTAEKNGRFKNKIYSSNWISFEEL